MKAKGRLFGYARVSTGDQDLALQRDALKKAGCADENVYTDKISGSKTERPGLDKCLAALHPGDTLVVWRLDRLGRSLVHLVGLVNGLKERGVGFKSLCDGNIDTTNASGELIFHIFTALAHFERRLIQERTKAGLSAARARGRLGGRKPIDPSSLKVKTAKNMHQEQKMSIQDICAVLKISRPTLYRYLALN